MLADWAPHLLSYVVPANQMADAHGPAHLAGNLRKHRKASKALANRLRAQHVAGVLRPVRKQWPRPPKGGPGALHLDTIVASAASGRSPPRPRRLDFATETSE